MASVRDTAEAHGGNAHELLNVDVGAGLDLLARRGEWKACLKEAEAQGGQVMRAVQTCTTDPTWVRSPPVLTINPVS